MRANFVRFRSSLFLVSLGLLLAACQHKQIVKLDPEAGNPFKYTKKSAVCNVTPIVKEQDGHWKTTMTLRSDDGECELKVQQPDSKNAFSSFGISEIPEHGKTFLYNYNQQTYVRYTSTTAYSGPDKFTVELLNQDGLNLKKTPLTVEVTVNNVDVQTVKPPVTVQSKTTVKSKAIAKSSKKVTRHKASIHHHRVRKVNKRVSRKA